MTVALLKPFSHIIRMVRKKSAEKSKGLKRKTARRALNIKAIFDSVNKENYKQYLEKLERHWKKFSKENEEMLFYVIRRMKVYALIENDKESFNRLAKLSIKAKSEEA